MFQRLLLGALCVLWASLSFAQTKHYYAAGEKVQLTPSSTQFIVTANTASTLATVKRTDVKQYDNWAHKPYAVVEATRSMRADEVANSLGFDTDEVQVSPAYLQADGFALYPTRTVVVKLKDKNDAAAMLQTVAAMGVKTIVKKFGTYRMEMNQLSDVFAAANKLEESGLAIFAQPDFYAPIERFQINDPLFSEQFQMHNTGQTIDGVAGANDADCNALEAWGISLGSSSITVAVIDDGLEDHEDLNNSSGQSRYTAGFSPANNGNGDAVSGSNHGVACAGSIAATHNSIGVRGVAPLVNLISVNIFVGGESTQDIADGITWANNQGADVMSNSWGYGSCTASFSNITNALNTANSNGRGGLGCLITFASGNDYGSCVSYPADVPSVVAVGAIANTGVKSAYSNAGPALDIVAPSNNVGGPGAGVRTTDRMGSPGYTSTNYTNTFGGTSSACPVVSGVAALVLGYNPNLTSGQLKTILYNSAIDMGASGFDNLYGNGRVNALGALQAAGAGGGPTCSDGIQNGQETGVDCGGPTCPSCPTGCNGTEVVLSITMDNYPEETSWTLTNDAGQTVASGGTYGSIPDGGNYTETICLVDDCYTFTINDTYGDGICCSYGNGSYSLTQGGTTLASGGSFGSSEATDFCIGGSGADTQAPTTPTGLSVSNEAETTLDLSWNASSDNVGVTGYNVYIDGSLAGTVTGTSTGITGLVACTSYTFAVSAVDAAGNESGTASASGTTTGCTGGGGGISEAYYFETGLQGWADGGSDCARVRTTTRSWEGQYSVRIRDNSGTASSMTSPSLDLSGASSVTVSFYFYPNSMENGEDFWLRYNSGSGWQTVATYASGSSFNNGSFYSAEVTLSSADYNLVNGAQFRFQCDASANADQIYIDEVIITSSSTSKLNTGTISTIEPVGGPVRFDNPDVADYEFKITPNPASDYLQVTADELIEEVSLYSIDGKLLLNRTIGNVETTTLDISQLPTGVYLLSVQTEEETNTERVVIRR
ncbi:S8 family serine peptidase [Neolewinella agarilytica]|uniref:Por secretion system C-terminal sorting domain-containing protein n=1 Tax=Neolewinella agarilytica TaxID=478744 RepID=A0A1H8YUI8_9BACT|nr:S8 family serine peptidase [Neolewinella agarilytica]SEP55884.1 Por secretion system C-terminal sorting domain-containing protein [Neolewinella agarilytica]